MDEYLELIKTNLPEKYLNKEYLHRYSYNEKVFYRLKKDIKGYPRGTVFWDRGILYGFHRIKRILNLSEGIKRYFAGRFYLEEKMDGYNIRIRRIEDCIYAFTRGGFVCPFTMDRLMELVDTAFFEEYPDYTLCGEIVGPDNPYNSEPVEFIKEDIRFYAFDIKDKEGKSLPLYDKYTIFRDLGVQAVRRWGPYDYSHLDKIKGILAELDKEGREGIVIKSIDDDMEIKYVTLGSCIRDINATASLFPELPGGFYVQRLIRILCILDESGLSLDKDIKERVSDSLLEPMMKTLKKVCAGEQIKEYFSIRVNKRETIDELMRHLKKMGISSRVLSIERAGRHYLARFYRTYPKGTRLLRKRLKGYGFYD